MKKEDLDNLDQFMNMDGADQLEELGFEIDEYNGYTYTFSMDLTSKLKDAEARAYIRVSFVDNCFYIEGFIENYEVQDSTTFFRKTARNWAQFETEFEKLIDYLEY